jgi:hypothetical protein
MGNLRNITFAAGMVLPLFAVSSALAGPCSDQIAAVSRILGAHPNVSGSPTTGTLNGAGPSDKSSAAVSNTAAQTKGTTADGGSLKGDSGNREMTAAASSTATSPEDVRRQQAGVATMADAPDAKTPNQHVAQATQQLDRARMLDAKNDPTCHEAVDQASQLAKSD